MVHSKSWKFSKLKKKFSKHLVILEFKILEKEIKNNLSNYAVGNNIRNILYSNLNK